MGVRSSVIIATRRSPLALWQSEDVCRQWLRFYPGSCVELLEVTTTGDRFLAERLQSLGGKGLFVKELQQLMLDGHADAAVHSLKDVPMVLPEGLMLAAYLPRASPFDAVVCRPSLRVSSLDELGEGMRIGTSSVRREAQLRHMYPQFEYVAVRGNVGRRLEKLDQGCYDALVLAEAGLQRLGLQHRISFTLPLHVSLPAVGQGVMAVEIPKTHVLATHWVALNDDATAYCARAERAFSSYLGGGCHVPLAGYARWCQDTHRLSLCVRVLSPDGRRCFEDQDDMIIRQFDRDPEFLGVSLGQKLLAQKSVRDCLSVP